MPSGGCKTERWAKQNFALLFLSGDRRTYLVCQLGLRVAASACLGIGPGSLDPPTRLQLELSEEAVSHYPSHQHLCDPTRLELIVGQVWSLTYICFFFNCSKSVDLHRLIKE